VHGNVPQLAFREATWKRADAGAAITAVTVALANSGQQSLTGTEFSLFLSDLDQVLHITAAVDSGSSTHLDFPLPAGFIPNENTRLTLEVFQPGPPAHRWRFSDRSIAVPGAH